MLGALLSLLLFMLGPVRSHPVDALWRMFAVSPEESLGAFRFWCSCGWKFFSTKAASLYGPAVIVRMHGSL